MNSNTTTSQPRGGKNSFMQNIQQNTNTKKHTQILLSRVRWKQRLHSRLPSTQLAKIQHSHAPTCWLLGGAWTSAPQTAGQESNPAGGQGLLLSYHSYFHCPNTHLGWQRCIYHYSGEKKKSTNYRQCVLLLRTKSSLAGETNVINATYLSAVCRTASTCARDFQSILTRNARTAGFLQVLFFLQETPLLVQKLPSWNPNSEGNCSFILPPPLLSTLWALYL